MVDAPSTRNTTMTIEELVRLDEQRERPKAEPKQLKLSDIKQAPAVFQPRVQSLMYAPNLSKLHVKTLTGFLLRTGEPLDPVVIASFGDEWYALDGHHRLEAYEVAKWSRMVPVRVAPLRLKGAARVQEAMVLALTVNIKDKLPMSANDKLDNAWRLTILYPEIPRAAVSRLTTCSESTVSNMRRAREALLRSEKYDQAELAGKPWFIARLNYERLGKEDSEFADTDRDEREISLACRHLKDIIHHVSSENLLRAIDRMRPGTLELLGDIIAEMKAGPEL